MKDAKLADSLPPSSPDEVHRCRPALEERSLVNLRDKVAVLPRICPVLQEGYPEHEHDAVEQPMNLLEAR